MSERGKLVIFDQPDHRLKSSKYNLVEGANIVGSDLMKTNI